MKYIPILLIAILCGLTGCYEDYDNSSEVLLEEESPQLLHNGSIAATIDNSSSTYFVNGNPAESVQEAVLVRDISLDANGQTIIGVNNQNVPTSLRQMTTIKSTTNYTALSSFDHEEILDFSSSVIGTPEITIDVRETAFQDIDGELVSGAVTLDYATITDPMILSQWHTYVEGDDFGEYLLDASLGIMLHFSDSNDQQLFAQALSISPADESQNIYYLDESRNRWRLLNEDVQMVDARFFLLGSATPAQVLTGTISYESDVISRQPLETVSADILHQSYSADNGQYRVFVSQEDEALITLTDPCGEAITDVAAPITLSHRDIMISEEQNFVDVNTEVIGCDGEVISESVMQVVTGGESYYLYQSSDLGQARWVPICGTNANFTSSILGESISGPVLTWSSDTFDQIGIISACPDHGDGYALIEIDGQRKVYNAFDVVNVDEELMFITDNEEFKIILRGEEKMQYATSMINLSIDDISFGDEGFFISCENSPLGCGIEFCDLTHLKSTGDLYDRIYFEGVAWMQKINSTTAGNYEIKGVIVQQ